VLIITTRPVARVADLVPAELSDIMLTAQTVSRMIESRFKSTGVTFAIQVTIGAVMSMLITLIVGFDDGFNTGWCFSWADCTARAYACYSPSSG